MKRIKHIIFGPRNLLIETAESTNEGTLNEKSKLFNEFTKFINFLRTKNIKPIVFTNTDWHNSKSKKTLEETLKKHWGDIPYFITIRDNLPKKPTAKALTHVLNILNCEENEVLYIGNSDTDMKTAVNGKVLFLNAVWFGQHCDYGFKFSSPKDIAKFIDIFCCRKHLWGCDFHHDSLDYYSLAPFGTFVRYEDTYGDYSKDARKTAKEALGRSEFWGRYLCATLFLSGIYKEINYICTFPAHLANRWSEPLKQSIDTFAKCFRIRYLSDLIIRHTTSPSSHKNRHLVSHKTNLNTIRLNQHPWKSNTARYLHSPLNPDKKVLVVDDFCTQGFSLEAARLLLMETGVNVIVMSWLKTVTRAYEQIVSYASFELNPYKCTNWDDVYLQIHSHPYDDTITDKDAYLELKEKFNEYDSWDWS